MGLQQQNNWVKKELRGFDLAIFMEMWYSALVQFLDHEEDWIRRMLL